MPPIIAHTTDKDDNKIKKYFDGFFGKNSSKKVLLSILKKYNII